MKKFLLMLFMLLPGLTFADNVSQEQAQAIAERFFANRGIMSTRAVALRMVWDGEDAVTRNSASPAFYVFNNVSGKGFVIVSGDDCTQQPILAYADDQHFDAEQMPENLRTWMKGIRSDINLSRQSSFPKSEKARRNWILREVNSKTPVVLLDTPLWDQRDPYNSKLPSGRVTGCPATAISIIMRYHKWPEKGVGIIPSYELNGVNVAGVTLGHTYDWDNMPMVYTADATQVQREQVGILMRDVGAMIRTQYGGGTAGAKPEETLPQLMPIHMRYNKSTIKSLFKKTYPDSEWHHILQKELDDKRPVLYGGYSSGGGHQFVLDGYAEGNYYHVNWGWSGVSNGYYLLTGMNPPEQGTGGSHSVDGFTQRQDAIIGIQPDPNNPGGDFFDLIAFKPWSSGTSSYGLSTKENKFEVNVPFTVSIKEFQNKGSRTYRGKLAIGHFNARGELKGIISNEVSYHAYPLEINDFTEANFKCQINAAIEKGDRLCGVFKYIAPQDWEVIRNGYPDQTGCVEELLLDGGGNTPQPTTDLDEHLSFKYNKNKQLLSITASSADEVTMQVSDSSGKDVTADICNEVGTGFTIDTKLLKGQYTLKFNSPKRGKYELVIKF